MAKRHTLRLAVLNSSPPLIFAFLKKQLPAYRIDESSGNWEMEPASIPKPLSDYSGACVFEKDGSAHFEQDHTPVW